MVQFPPWSSLSLRDHLLSSHISTNHKNIFCENKTLASHSWSCHRLHGASLNTAEALASLDLSDHMPKLVLQSESTAKFLLALDPLKTGSLPCYLQGVQAVFPVQYMLSPKPETSMFLS